jgi:hypothetical protein
MTGIPQLLYSNSAGLLFAGRNDGRLTALNSSNGMPLWEFQTGAGVNAPSSVFEYQGNQYVVVLSAGNLMVGTPKGDSNAQDKKDYKSHSDQCLIFRHFFYLAFCFSNEPFDGLILIGIVHNG